MVHLGELDIGSYALKVSLGALGGDYGDFFPQVGEKDIGFVNIRHIWTIPLSIFPNSYSLPSISTVYWYYCS
jgi:hypothetical protein